MINQFEVFYILPSNKPGIAAIDAALAKLQHTHVKNALEPGLELAQTVLDLFVGESQPSVEDIVSDGLIQMPNAERQDSWFVDHPWMEGARSAFEIFDSISKPVQAKFFWLKKRTAAQIAGSVHLTPNWEDFEYTRQNESFKVGIDFFLSPDAKSFYIVLSNSGKLRVMELSQKLNRTQVEILESWIELEKLKTQEDIHSALWQSFQLQSVNAQFYEGVSDAFLELVDKLSADGRDEQDSKLFASRLLGRLIFVWFLRKMGMVAGCIDYFSPEDFDSDSAYYKSALESLFFRTLNEPAANRLPVNGLIDLETPYLNGGLFAPHSSDWANDTSLTFPKGYFARVFEHFQKFNFTVDESTPEFEQVAIDPEMLGRVFESLLATQVEETGEHARKAKGTFYTPREIVFFMCREAIRTYLQSERPGDDSYSKSIRHVLDTSDQDWAKAGTNSLRDIPKNHREQILARLGTLRSIDPACGSGAFPLGLLNVLTKIILRLTPDANAHDVKTKILQNSIYGVDIEPMAIEISKLRAWLALIVEEAKGPMSVQPLPNLEFKFVCANSLIPLAGEDETTLFDDGKIEAELQEIRDKYYATKDPSKKVKLKERYASAVAQGTVLFGETKRSSQLRTFKPFEDNSVAEFFDPSAMFGFEKFHVVIGNPPYVRQEKIKYKNLLKDYQLFQSTADLYTYFYELALNSVVDGGVVSFITSSKFGRALYGEKLRAMLANETQLTCVVDFGTKHVFTAITNTWVVQVKKEKPSEESHFCLKLSIEDSGATVRQNQLSSSSWSFADLETSLLLDKIARVGGAIAKAAYQISYGLKTGCNEGFVIDADTKDLLVRTDPRSAEIIKPLLRGRDIGRYSTLEASTWILATKNGLDVERDFPTIAAYLMNMNDSLDGKLLRRGDQGNHWMNLRDCTYYDSMEGKKIVWLELSDKNKFAMSEGGEYILAGAWMIVGPHLEALLGVLNSKLVRFYFNHISNSSGMGTTQWKKFAVERIPIPDFDKLDVQLLSKLEALVTTVSETKAWSASADVAVQEAEIDSIIYEFYGLNENEIHIIESGI
jgi:type I restriction-modification system DNA methylase subunit